MNKAEKTMLSEVSTFERFCKVACNTCNNEWYCPTYCEPLEKAKKMPFEKLQKAYVRNEGDMRKVWRYIRRYRGAGR